MSITKLVGLGTWVEGYTDLMGGLRAMMGDKKYTGLFNKPLPTIGEFVQSGHGERGGG